MNKYRNIRTKWNDRVFDSRAEARAAQILDIRKRNGEIVTIEYQPRIELIPKPNRITYVGDFRVVWANGIEEIIDIKGVETAVFKLKAKLFRHFYPEKRLRIAKAVDSLLPPCVVM